MKYITFLVFLISQVCFSQIGINTTNPSALLDINSETQGVLMPRVELVETMQALPVVNPTGDPLENGTLVYNTETINDVRPGFYYWLIDRWVRLSSEPQFLQFTSITLPFPSSTNNDVDFLLDGVNYTYNVFRIEHAGADLGGIIGGVHGRILYIYNGDPINDLKLLAGGNSGSDPENQFSLQGDVILKPGNAIIVFYDGLYLDRWTVARSDN